jgi:hypothetical protein
VDSNAENTTRDHRRRNDGTTNLAEDDRHVAAVVPAAHVGLLRQRHDGRHHRKREEPRYFRSGAIGPRQDTYWHSRGDCLFDADCHCLPELVRCSAGQGRLHCGDSRSNGGAVPARHGDDSWNRTDGDDSRTLLFRTDAEGSHKTIHNAPILKADGDGDALRNEFQRQVAHDGEDRTSDAAADSVHWNSRGPQSCGCLQHC